MASITWPSLNTGGGKPTEQLVYDAVGMLNVSVVKMEIDTQ